ncbi:MAG: hypothetical protein JSW71_11960 [Gemmatimonadota bacterium]|nr:MAG: hypothetical protein JSW71_11960 [Gemmatimonadota bacterium]
MKKVLKLLIVLLALATVVTLVKYRTLSPCGMLKKEWVERARQQVEVASARARDVAEDLGGSAERIAADVGESLEETAKEIAETVAETAADEKSLGECVVELWDMKVGKR